MADDEDNPFMRIRTFPCEQCGRKFKQESLAKHRKVCKNITKPRKMFDSGRQRAQNSDVNYRKTKETLRVQIEGEKPVEAVRNTSNWREKHNEFIRSIRAARGVTEALRTGAPLPKNEPSAVPSDYVNCQFCGRNFNRNAAERHIPFCENQSKRQKANTSANQKQVVRNKPVPAPQRKQSSEAYGYANGGQSEYARPRNYGSGNQGAIAGGSGYSTSNGTGSGGTRKPIRYEARNYDSDYADSGGAYAKKNRATVAANGTRTIQKSNDQMLRTGRNLTNSELNALARNRSGNSQRESPKNSRDPSVNRRAAVAPQRATHARYQENYGAKFCHECGSEFPVEWARFCSFCGSGRA
ncbi:zinc finger C2HC domain-containing 1A isoform X1 [Brachionus plicatilis]|uniref:Zinc finger C2HC domain-containing 1A isoform X1 n=1 Tax=Brachionus plicatilis TaxID=10195 RepID=A0A3M7SSP2_BRAPC|nr:zinc finger C2HC domain-containing 1A isoform X1 [Brachionus plicatilis]